MLCLMANRDRHQDSSFRAQSSSSSCSAPHTTHCRTARSARHKASHRIRVRTSSFLAYPSLSWPSTDAMFFRQCRLSQGAAACLPMITYCLRSPTQLPCQMRQVPREAAKAVGNGWEDPRVLFRNETQWSKLKRTTLSPVCCVHVKWPYSPGTTIAL